MPPQRRVLRSGDFTRIERQGTRTAGALLVLLARMRRDGRPGRVGFTVSKKVGNAVVRNRVRRRLREIVRRHKEWLDARDLIVIVKPEAASADAAALAAQLASLVERIARQGSRSVKHEPTTT
ncbi:MAG: ribonuclease P protein component [Deltaproteobacteria bacterium]|nr:ribonuclease P protein component [Deltaproteobacteria bacterium]